jgi:hypothetical protein
VPSPPIMQSAAFLGNPVASRDMGTVKGQKSAEL